MKRWTVTGRWRALGLAGLLGSVPALVPGVRAQEFRIVDSSVDAGGGVSRGGGFEVHGTIGQPDVGVAVGGAYVVKGGFWAGGVQVVQVAGLPQLRVRRLASGLVEVSWDDAEGRYQLQESRSLADGSWSPTSRVVQASGAVRSVHVPGLPGGAFFRLAEE